MNKKDIAHIRRQFKPENELLKINDIYNVYIMKETSEIYYHESQRFNLLERDQQELFLMNFKKLLGGQIDEKLFEIKFMRDVEDPTQLILHQGLQAIHVEDWIQYMLRIVDKMLHENQYPQDTVITFIRGTYYKPTKVRNEETEESEKDEMFAHPFILCSVNTTEQLDKTLVFDYVEKQFRYNVAVDPVIKLASPEAGFWFPCITEGVSDVNRVMYSAGKANAPDARFIEEVLNGTRNLTSQEDKSVFEEIVNEVAGEQLDTGTLAKVYEEIQRVIEENEEEEPPKLDYKDVERVLTVSGVENVTAEHVGTAFETVLDNRNYEMKAHNVVPKYTSKSIKIDTKVATITVSPQDLKYVKQVVHQGKRCILIEVDEDTYIEGFKMNVEPLES